MQLSNWLRNFVISICLIGMTTMSLAATPLPLNPRQLAKAETATWQDYYAKDTTNLSKHVVAMFMYQYGLTAEQALNVAQYYAKAVSIFGDLPQNSSEATYQAKVLPILTTAYETLSGYVNIADYKAAAKYDLAWWVDRRNPQTATPMQVGHNMAQMFAAIYGPQGQRYFERAGYLRAVAGQYRDLSADKWTGIHSNDWEIIHHLLTEAYKLVYAGAK